MEFAGRFRVAWPHHHRNGGMACSFSPFRGQVGPQLAGFAKDARYEATVTRSPFHGIYFLNLCARFVGPSCQFSARGCCTAFLGAFSGSEGDEKCTLSVISTQGQNGLNVCVLSPKFAEAHAYAQGEAASGCGPVVISL